MGERPCPVWLLRAMTGIDDLALAAALDAAFAQGLLAETPGGIEFGPAACPTQILDSLSASTRGLLHTRAAAVLVTAAPTAAVRHATAALTLTGRVDPELIDAFVDSSAAEPSALADLLLAAQGRDTAGDVPQRRRWLLAMADNLVLAGRGSQALRLLAAEIATDRAGGAYRSQVLGRLAGIYAGQQPSVAFACLRGALAQERLDPGSRSTLLAMVSALAARLGHPDADALLREAGSAHADDGTSASAIHLALGRAARRLSIGDLPGASAVLATLDPDAPVARREAALIRSERIFAQLGLGRYDEARAATRRACDEATPTGTPGVLIIALDCLRMIAVGELSEAAAVAATTLGARAHELSQEVRALLVAVVAEVRYRRGEPEAARASLRDCLDVDRRWPDSTMWTLAGGVAAADLALAEQPRMLAGALADLHRSVRSLLPVPQLGPRLVRAALAGGDPRAAGRVAELVDQVAVCTPVPLWRALADQTRGLVERDAGALRAAVDGLRTTAARPALADALLDLAHSPQLRRTQAREAAREAAGLYGRIGALGDQRTAEHRAAELARRTRRQPAGGQLRTGLDSLTPAEARVAEMLAAGATKQQAAGSLFVSFHTVDTHLRSIYQKLGIRTRLQLVRAWDQHRRSAD
ncbi:LuxR C-terminal-related transcriptional regulator [Micromonospora sp. NPDC051296]|uniref:LuxR C-terminal-related transcriptional regulator n=1 Tax=Micromonospora sp. NPDC051296 TaxID=3155046 RepID=UPI003420A41C